MIKNNSSNQSVEVSLECPLVSHAMLARHEDVESEFEGIFVLPLPMHLGNFI